MQIEPHANLTITLINRNTYSTLRLRGASPRRVVHPDYIHQCDRARIAPPAVYCRETPRGFPWEGAFPWGDAFPYDDRPEKSPPPAPSGQSLAPGLADHLGTRIDVWA